MGLKVSGFIFFLLAAITTALNVPVYGAQVEIEGLNDGVYLIDNLEGSAIKLPEVSVDRSNEPRELLVTLPKADVQPLIVGKFDEDTYERTANGYILVKLSPSLNPKVKRIETGFGSQMRFFNDPVSGGIAAFIVGYPEELTAVTSQDYLKMLFEESGNQDGIPLSALPIVNKVPNGIRLDFCLPLQMAQVSGPTQVIMEIATDLGVKSYAFTVGEEGLYVFRPGQFPEPLFKLATWSELKTEKWWNAEFDFDKISFILEGTEYEGPMSFKSTTDLRYMLSTDAGAVERIKAMPVTQKNTQNGSGIEAALDTAEILQVNKLSAGAYTVDWSSLYYTPAYQNGTRMWLLANDSVVWTPIVLE